jgi:hypothetical protein
MLDPLSFTRYPAVVLYECEADSMATNWTEYIVVTRSDKANYCVYVRKNIEEWINGRYIRKMRTQEKVVGMVIVP